jgi:hypothetical protein
VSQSLVKLSEVTQCVAEILKGPGQLDVVLGRVAFADQQVAKAHTLAMFDGPADLAARSGEGLFGEAEGQ